MVYIFRSKPFPLHLMKLPNVSENQCVDHNKERNLRWAAVEILSILRTSISHRPFLGLPATVSYGFVEMRSAAETEPDKQMLKWK